MVIKLRMDPDPADKSAGGSGGSGGDATAADEVKDLKTKVGEFRDSNVALRKELDGLKDKFGEVNLDDYKKAVDFMTKLEQQQSNEEEAKLLKAGNIDDVVARRTDKMRADYTKQQDALTAARDTAVNERNALGTKLGELLIGRDAQVEASNLGVKLTKGGLRDFLSRAHADWVIDGEGNMVAQRAGEKLFGSDGAPLKMKEWAESIVDEAPHLFEGSTGGGATGGRKGISANSKVVKWGDKKGFMNNLEAIAKGDIVVEEP